MSYAHGVLTTADNIDTFGVIQSISFNPEVQQDQFRNKEGNTAYFEQFDKTTRLSVTVRWYRATARPAIGSTVTIAATPGDEFNGKYTVEPSPAEESNTVGVTCTMNLVRFVDGAIPTA